MMCEGCRADRVRMHDNTQAVRHPSATGEDEKKGTSMNNA